MTAVKFCGMRTKADIEAAIRAGCDWIGLNFVEQSPRFLEIDTAVDLIKTYGMKLVFVGVFKDPAEVEVSNVLDRVPLDFLQFSGSESADFCRSFDLPYVKGLHVSSTFDFDTERERYADAFAYLLDSVSELGGGSGKSFEWVRFPENSDAKLILAGGLNAGNVADAIQQTRPWGVDVASGIEEADHTKSFSLMSRFMQGVRSVST